MCDTFCYNLCVTDWDRARNSVKIYHLMCVILVQFTCKCVGLSVKTLGLMWSYVGNYLEDLLMWCMVCKENVNVY